MAAFNYIISVTGNCSTSQYGTISLALTGGTPPYTVEWVDPNLGSDVIIFDPSVRTGLIAGNYAVRVNDTTIPLNQEFYINIPVSDGVCCSILNVTNTTCNLYNGSVTGTSTSDYSSTDFSLYDSGDTFVASAITNVSTVVFNNLSGGTYYIIAQDLGGCTGRSETFIVEDSTPLTFGLYIVPNSSCGGTPIGKIFVTGQTGASPYTYLWSDGQTGSTITGLTSGNYSVQVTDNLGCQQTEGGYLGDVAPVGFGIFTVTPPGCFSNDGVVNLTITGGTAPYYYSASTGNVLVSYSQTYTLSGLSSGQYDFLVTDAGLCSFQTGVTLATPQGITSINIITQGSTCSSVDGSITITTVGGTSPFTYTIIYPNGNSTNVNSVQTSQTFTNLTSGTYTVAVQDASGCALIQETSLVAEDTFTISAQTTGTTCSQSNGTILVTRSAGGIEPFDFSLDGLYNVIDTNLSAVTFTNVSTGQHTITVTDATGCTQTSQVYVDSSTALDFTLYKTSCGSGSEGTINAFISSGLAPFTFNWSSNVSGNPQQIQVDNLSAGTYSLTIIDSNGCSLKRTTIIACDSSYVSYQTYVMGSEVFRIQSPSKYGLLQMLNEGYYDLTSGNTSCDLISATFTAKVSVQPLGTTTSQDFYTSTSLVSVPGDNVWYDTIKNILLSISGVGNVIIDSINNQITIETSKTNNSLNGQEIIIELIIVYDIMCLT